MNFFRRHMWATILFCFFCVMLLIITANNRSIQETPNIENFASENTQITNKKETSTAEWIQVQVPAYQKNYNEDIDSTQKLKNTTTNIYPRTQSLASLWYEPRIAEEQFMQKRDIWSQYKVSVHALKLNNKYFNETLWYLHNGDMLTQLSSENMYGCFLAEHLTDAWEKKEWYVCRKYLEYISDDTQDEANLVGKNEENNEIVQLEYDNFKETFIWDMIILEKEQYDYEGKALFSWDIINQWSQLDEFGCFYGSVVYTHPLWYPELVWKLIHICQKDIYK